MKTITTRGFVLPQPYEVLLGFIPNTYWRREYRSQLKKHLKKIISQRELISFYETCLEEGERFRDVDEFSESEIEEDFIKYEKGYRTFNKSVRYLNTCIKQEKRLQNQYEVQLEELERKIFDDYRQQFNLFKNQFDLFKKGSLVGGEIK